MTDRPHTSKAVRKVSLIWLIAAAIGVFLLLPANHGVASACVEEQVYDAELLSMMDDDGATELWEEPVTVVRVTATETVDSVAGVSGQWSPGLATAITQIWGDTDGTESANVRRYGPIPLDTDDCQPSVSEAQASAGYRSYSVTLEDGVNGRVYVDDEALARIAAVFGEPFEPEIDQAAVDAVLVELQQVIDGEAVEVDESYIDESDMEDGVGDEGGSPVIWIGVGTVFVLIAGAGFTQLRKSS